MKSRQAMTNSCKIAYHCKEMFFGYIRFPIRYHFCDMGSHRKQCKIGLIHSSAQKFHTIHWLIKYHRLIRSASLLFQEITILPTMTDWVFHRIFLITCTGFRLRQRHQTAVLHLNIWKLPHRRYSPAKHHVSEVHLIGYASYFNKKSNLSSKLISRSKKLTSEQASWIFLKNYNRHTTTRKQLLTGLTSSTTFIFWNITFDYDWIGLWQEKKIQNNKIYANEGSEYYNAKMVTEAEQLKAPCYSDSRSHDGRWLIGCYSH